MEISISNKTLASGSLYSDAGGRSIHEAARAASIMQRALKNCSRAVSGTTRSISRMSKAALKAANAFDKASRVRRTGSSSRKESALEAALSSGRSYGGGMKDLKSNLGGRAGYSHQDITYAGAVPQKRHPDYAPDFWTPVPPSFNSVSNGGITVAGITLAPSIGISASILGSSPNSKEADERELASRIDRELASLWKSSRSELRRLIER